jgi:alkylresorcinol/alkylpyrone synthase
VKIAAVGRAFPPHYYGQHELATELRRIWARGGVPLDRLESLHQKVLVGGRYLALPLAEYDQLQTFGQANDAWIRVAQQVGEAAVRDAFTRAGVPLSDADAFVFVTVTGLATPSLDARLMNRLGLPARVKRTPLFGLGCAGGAAALARAADYLHGHPGGVAIALSVELCSLTVQKDDLSVANLIATGLFGDGAAAVVLLGAERAERAEQAERANAHADARANGGPRILATRSVFYPDSEHLMGWRISERGFQILLSPRIPEIARECLRSDVETFLAEQGLSRRDIASWVCHPGGPRVLEAVEEALELTQGELGLAWESLRQMGNMSSASVLLVLGDTIDQRRPPPGSLGVLLAMGPGFCTELLLLQW